MRPFAASLIVLLAASPAWAPGEEYGKQDAALIHALARSKIALADAIANAGKRGVPIAARFELDDSGRLSVVVRVARQGVDSEIESNSFEDLRADPAKAWSPRPTAIRDPFLLTRASQQVLLIALSQQSLLQAARTAERDGTLYSISPDVRRRRGVFVALVVSGGKPREVEYGISTR